VVRCLLAGVNVLKPLSRAARDGELALARGRGGAVEQVESRIEDEHDGSLQVQKPKPCLYPQVNLYTHRQTWKRGVRG
jgi:hypothetical protein